MKRPLRADELQDWAQVARTIELLPGRVVPEIPEARAAPVPRTAPGQAVPLPSAGRPGPKPVVPPDPIEPKRHKRIIRARDPIEARLDLHGLDYDRARAALHDFLRRAHANGMRAVLVITGKGREGEGLLKRYAPEWLNEPAVRPMIAGVSAADRRHGGEGALYIALKRKTAGA